MSKVINSDFAVKVPAMELTLALLPVIRALHDIIESRPSLSNGRLYDSVTSAIRTGELLRPHDVIQRIQGEQFLKSPTTSKPRTTGQIAMSKNVGKCVFDIRAMKELRVLKGHKKEVCSLVSGGSEGAVLHWDLSNFCARTLVTHDSNVWSLTFHPLGHILVTALNDHTTRFWSRERPGDATSVFSGGGEKPPDMVDMSRQDDEEGAIVPGFSYGGGTGGGVGASGNGITGLNTGIGTSKLDNSASQATTR
ncbi:hypothetical protein SCLCIDRAFT_31887 [Scleroderma citrinum Foug A]|uniref:Polyadenylation factor subunit 2 n=1 Tax=Scleroderma citrinum Foug A TaxID=1036808 RepID=A0A0C3DBA5_9AGAM|nr:hypothetical protein SCLCIDRAFT_31887 [Scleroderma citrinum Foug A]